MGAPAVVMYITSWCPYCQRVRRLLGSKNVSIDEIDIESQPAKRVEMQNRSGRSTVPQIFIGDRHVGGSDDLQALEDAGELDGLLGR